jgi:hypothetical protein
VAKAVGASDAAAPIAEITPELFNICLRDNSLVPAFDMVLPIFLVRINVRYIILPPNCGGGPVITAKTTYL